MFFSYIIVIIIIIIILLWPCYKLLDTVKIVCTFTTLWQAEYFFFEVQLFIITEKLS